MDGTTLKLYCEYSAMIAGTFFLIYVWTCLFFKPYKWFGLVVILTSLIAYGTSAAVIAIKPGFLAGLGMFFWPVSILLVYIRSNFISNKIK